MTDTSHLLAEYVRDGSEAAFRELVHRYVDLVYSAAVRLAGGDPHLAEDITQTVFADLARRARTLAPGVMLGGWLHRHTCYVASNLLRRERRRQAREWELMQMNTAPDHSEASLRDVASILDDAINALPPDDRTAVLLRFFERQDFRAVGVALGSSEEAARKRVARALDKLHSLLEERGVLFPATALGSSLAAGAVTAAPAAFAATVGATALAGAAATGGTGWGLFNLVAMSKLKTGLAAMLIAAAITAPLLVHRRTAARLRETEHSLRLQREEAARLGTENERLASILAQRDRIPGPRLTAPAVAPSTAPVGYVPERAKVPNVIAHLLNGGEPPKLSAQQLESYLAENHRDAGSLLAAFRTTGDDKLLREAMERFPDDPQVAFAAAFRKEAPPEERRRWLEAFKKNAPENALASYLLASDYFQAGQADAAIEELTAAGSRQRLQDYSSEFAQNDEEAWRASGYSVAESKTLASMLLVLPHLAQLKRLSQDTLSLAESYRQLGDDASSQAALQFAVQLGERLDGSPGQAMINELVGLAIKTMAYKAMDPDFADASGRTAREHVENLARERADIRERSAQVERIMPGITEHDWISYKDRWRSFGERAATEWLISKYGPREVPPK